jgi:hypothetical protein
MSMPSAETVPASLAITLFGPMQVLVHGYPLPPLRSRKPLWLLVLLILRPNRPVVREWLAGTLWPDVDQSRAFANLRPALSELRKALATESARLHSPDRHTLMLDLTDAEVDLLRFDAALASRTLSALEQAVRALNLRSLPSDREGENRLPAEKYPDENRNRLLIPASWLQRGTVSVRRVYKKENDSEDRTVQHYLSGCLV